jgi:hypothetical protein
MRGLGNKENNIDRIQAWAGQSAALAAGEPASAIAERSWTGAQALLGAAPVLAGTTRPASPGGAASWPSGLALGNDGNGWIPVLRRRVRRCRAGIRNPSRKQTVMGPISDKAPLAQRGFGAD